jgi:hypothetical protein
LTFDHSAKCNLTPRIQTGLATPLRRITAKDEDYGYRSNQNSLSIDFHILVDYVDIGLLLDEKRFPDSSFSASASSVGHSASDARMSSGSSWCAPALDKKHFLQVDFGRYFIPYFVATYGDSTSPKWVASYNLNYTDDLLNWKNATTNTGNKVTANIYINSKNICTIIYINDLSINLMFSDIFRKQKCL